MPTTAHRYMENYSSSASADEAVSATVAGFAYSYVLTALLSALLVVAKEESATVLHAMQALTGNHWITHGAIDILAFLILGLLLSRSWIAQSATAGALIWAIVGSTILSGALIFGFYAY